MSKSKYLLSICIPTYNRADVLKYCMDAIVNHEQTKKGGIEIVVCDNASMDGTEALMQTYKDLDYVKYYRNEENVGVIYNTIRVLDYATGEYKKLLNDYSIFTKEGLQIMYDKIASHRTDRPVLIFNNAYEHVVTKQTFYKIDDVVKRFGILLTWMGTYGYWEEDWDSIKEKDKYADKTFITIDYLLQMVDKKKQVNVYTYFYTDRGEYKQKQGGYNFFKVFIQEYLDLWYGFIGSYSVTLDLCNWIKKDMWPYVWGYTKKFLIKKESGSFQTNDALKLLFRYYGAEWYVWWFLITYPFTVIKREIARRKQK